MQYTGDDDNEENLIPRFLPPVVYKSKFIKPKTMFGLRYLLS